MIVKKLTRAMTARTLSFNLAKRTSGKDAWRPRSMLWIGALLFAQINLAHAAGGISLELGVDDDDDDVTRFALSFSYELPYRWFDSGDWYLGTYFEADAHYWDGEEGTTGTDSLASIGLVGVLRFQRNPAAGIAPFVEFGTGPHLQTESEISNKDFDIAFAFGSHVGGGVRFGANGRYELMYRYQHLSNAGIGDDNPGINFHLVRLGYWF